jgi:hypothetical protein
LLPRFRSSFDINILEELSHSCNRTSIRSA